jgi:hypothetical protein
MIHGTDIAISVDGICKYGIMHMVRKAIWFAFVIPETVEKIDFGKGTYYASRGICTADTSPSN